MCNSPSANYYKPTDEPEPWDLTQLNIEASVMCLVSKVKFLCGRCSSPAVRLRNKNGIDIRNQGLKRCMANNRNSTTGVVTIQPKNGIKTDEANKLLDNGLQQTSDKQNLAATKAKEGMRWIYIN